MNFMLSCALEDGNLIEVTGVLIPPRRIRACERAQQERELAASPDIVS